MSDKIFLFFIVHKSSSPLSTGNQGMVKQVYKKYDLLK